MADKPVVSAAAPVTPAAAPAKVDPKAAAPVVEESWDVQEDGKTIKRTRKEILEAYQLRTLSDRKRTEAEKIQKDWAQIEALGKSDPIKLLKLMGHNVDDLTSSYVAKLAQEKMEEQSNPEGVKARKVQEELDGYKAYVKRQKEESEKAASQAEFTKAWQGINTEIVEALKEQVALGYEVDEETVMEVAKRMQLQDMKQKPLSAKEALPAVFKADQTRIQKITKPMNGEQLLALFGPDTYKKILKHALQAEKLKRQPKVAPIEKGARVVPHVDKATGKPVIRSWSDIM